MTQFYVSCKQLRQLFSKLLAALDHGSRGNLVCALRFLSPKYFDIQSTSEVSGSMLRNDEASVVNLRCV